MDQRLRWRPTWKQLFIATGIVAVIGLIVAIIGGYRYNWEWTGLNHFTYTTTDNQEFQRGRTLWDWMQLLIVPVVIAVGGFLYNRAERRIEHQRAEERTRLERATTEDNQREATLQTYLDQMTELLLKEKLRESEPGAEVRDVARVRTLTALRRLNSDRRNILLRFLKDAELIGSGEDNIIDFRNVDLAGVDLGKTNLWGINLTEAVLESANLAQANLAEHTWPHDVSGPWEVIHRHCPESHGWTRAQRHTLLP